jgi:putative DNA primase/helicase
MRIVTADNKNNPDNARLIADMIDGGDFNLPPAAFPEAPYEEGAPDYGPSDDDAEMLPHHLDHDEMRKVDNAAIEACAREPQNDTGNGQRLLRYFGRELLHVREVGWHYWTGRCWELSGGAERATLCAQKTAARIALEADYLTATPHEKAAMDAAEDAAAALERLPGPRDQWSDETRKKAHALEYAIEQGRFAREQLQKRQIARRRFSVSSGNASRIAGMLAQALPHRTIDPTALDADPLAFNVENGTLHFVRELDLECPDPDAKRYTARVELRPHDPDDLIAKCAPVIFDAQAQCPRFMAFLDKFQPARPVRDFLQIYHGYALLGLAGEQCLVFNVGSGGNGKSTFLDLVCRIMGPYAQTLQFASLAEMGFGRRGDQATPDVARLPGARLVRASEPKPTDRFDESMIKTMTGGEPMLVRHLQKGFFEFRPVFKLALSGNHKPQISGVDHGIWRRMRIVPWPVQIAEADRRPIEDVLAELWGERSGILNWLIEGALRYLREGLQIPSEVADATADYREEMDPVGGFIRDCIEIVPPPADGDPPCTITARDMYNCFDGWCDENSVRPWKEQAFGRALIQKGFQRARSASVRQYINVRFKQVMARKPASAPHDPPPPSDDDVPI